MSALALLAALFQLSSAQAAFHIGPQLGFQVYHRNSPEETASTRASGLLSIKFDFYQPLPLIAEVGASYETGLDQFATQDAVNDRIFRGRLGLIYKPFSFEYPFFGLRVGGQYSVVTGVYDIAFPASTTDLTPRFVSPYFGAVLGMLPQGGFGVEDEFTVWYDQYFRCLVFQMAFGLDVL